MISKEAEGSLYRLSYLDNALIIPGEPVPALIIPGELVRRLGFPNRKGAAVGLVIECESDRGKKGWRRVTVLWGQGER